MTHRIAQTLSLALLLLAVFLTYANTIDDLDLWWHLKSGQVMHDTGNIISQDTFAYTSYLPDHIASIGKDEVEASELPNDNNNRFLSSSFIKRNWLSQLILYFSYSLMGYAGIGLLKSTIFIMAFALLYMAMRKRESAHLSAFLVVCLVAYIGIDFNYTRPQIFSYMLFACMMYVIFDFKKGGKSIYVLPFIVLSWANLHGGFVLGILIILAVISGEVIKYALHNFTHVSRVDCLPKERLTLLVVIAAVSVLITLANPSGYNAYIFPFMIKNSIFSTIEEYQKPMLYENHAYWFMLAAVGLFGLMRAITRQLDLTDVLVLLLLIAPSLKSIKYIIYFAIGSGAFLASSLSYTLSAMRTSAPFSTLTSYKLFSGISISNVSAFVTLFISMLVLFNVSASGNVMNLDMREKRYPSGAVDFIRENNISGNMFNLFNWGGYLVWGLYPEHRVFIYGRAVHETAFFHYTQIIKAAEGKHPGMPLWKRLLTEYDVNIILVPAVSTRGQLIGLVERLYYDPAWELIYADGKSLLFMKETDDNRETIHKHYISKEKIFDEIISECLQGIADTPATWGYYETLGYLYMKLSRVDEAIKMFEKYLSMNPNNNDVTYYYNLMKQYKGSQHGREHQQE